MAYIKRGWNKKNAFKKGSKNPRWKGGRKIDGYGYVHILKPNHPNAIKGYVREHRLVMEKKIKRYLKKNEVVHHINGIKDDNRIKNLKLMTRSKHNFQERKELWEKTKKNKELLRKIRKKMRKSAKKRVGKRARDSKGRFKEEN